MFILTLFVVGPSGQQPEDENVWSKLKISLNFATLFHDEDQVVKVYKQRSKSNITDKEISTWYFFFPVNRLLPQRAMCSVSRATKSSELRFSIEFWNEELRRAIVDHLRDNEAIGNAKVAVIPFEQVSLTSHFDIYRPTSGWMPFQKQVLFRWSVDSESECNQLRDRLVASHLPDNQQRI